MVYIKLKIISSKFTFIWYIQLDIKVFELIIESIVIVNNKATG